MATFQGDISQSTGEIRTHTIDYTLDLPTGGTVVSATATHIPPSGVAGTVTVTASSPYVYATLGPLSVVGQHYVSVIATFSDNQKSEVRLALNVFYPTTAARDTMADLIAEIRAMTDTGTNDYTVGAAAFWSDKQLQDTLDRHREDVFSVEILPQDEYSGGSTIYKTYRMPGRNFEGGTALSVLDYNGDAVGTALYTAYPSQGKVVFASNTAGSTYYISGARYELEAAAADIWKRKAAHYAAAYNISTDNQRLDRGALIQHALTMAREYDSYAPVKSIHVCRGDE